MGLRNYSNLAGITSIGNPGGISGSATSMYCQSTAGFPASTPFTLWLAPNTPTPELVEVTAGAGTVGSPFTIARGIDGTTAQTHGPGTVVYHAGSARDLSEPNAHLNSSGPGLTPNPHGLPDAAWTGTTNLNAAVATINANMALLLQTSSTATVGANKPSNSTVFSYSGSAVTTVSNTSGGFAFNYGITFTGYTTVLVTPGDSSASIGSIVPILANCTTSAFGGIALQRGSTSVVSNGSLIRVNFIVIGW